MRFLFLLAAAGLAASPALAARGSGAPRGREQDAAYRPMQQGRILSLPEIRARIRIPRRRISSAPSSTAGVYRLKFMRGADVIWIDVDARTGRVLGRQ